ncbi:unnamed protein product [Adineta steineri]|uniref:ubiquitinyl hydrolase 1 n=1 Tax=Adineta steineri TaxID=433720 RepID=A0A814IVN3_9BILA|nr:unnamed protein product [Adineta steineri]
MDASVLNHLFLPQHLPSSADADYLIGQNHQHEHELLEHMNEYFYTIASTDIVNKLPVMSILMECINRWSHLQNRHNYSITNIQSTLEQIPSDHFLPLYFHAQNAAILIEIDSNNNQPLISAWQVLLPTDVITSSLMPHFSCFPVATYRLRDRSELAAQVQCELLMNFMIDTIEYSKSYKASNEFDETREVPQSHYVCCWWIEQFEGVMVDKTSSNSVQFKKKHRDQIRWNSAALPFRRSGLWMTIKVVLHTILIKRLQTLGTIVYKLLITHFFTYVIKNIPMPVDLLVHCIRKIARRLNKIKDLLVSIKYDDKSIRTWINHTKQQIEFEIRSKLPDPNWQNVIRMDEKLRLDFCGNYSKLNNNRNIYKHSCKKLQNYLRTNMNSKNKIARYKPTHAYDDSSTKDLDDYIPSYDILTKTIECTTNVALTYMEIWVELCLEQWINHSSSTIHGKNRFEILFEFFETYKSAALNYYYSEKDSNDSISYSRFILTSLTILYCMHQKLCQNESFARLKEHSIDIPNLFDLFELLTLPTRDDMVRAYNLYKYFENFKKKQYPDILSNIDSKNAFGVYYAGQSTTMLYSIQRIRSQADRDKHNKIAEVKKAKENYTQLMDVVNKTVCDPCTKEHQKICARCKILAEANKIRVQVFECPIPSKLESALAMIFELQMPIEIRCYRDVLWQFISRLQKETKQNTYEWLKVPPHESKLKSYNNNSIKSKVRLVSSIKSITQSHYSPPPSIGSTSVTGFLFENSLKVQISPNKPMLFDDECVILTPKINHPDYKKLQFTIRNTQFLQNHVIARLADCPIRMKTTQFVEFGSFRSGHRLQWWNLLIIFEMDSLLLAEESVVILIMHSLLQYGPVTIHPSSFSNSWCPGSHRELLEDHFVDELILRLDRRLDECKLNWQNELVLLIISIITMRILTICNSSKVDKIVNLAKKTRRISENWIDSITKTIQTISPTAFDEVERLRIKMINIAIACVLTFSTHDDRIKQLISSNQDIISLLKAAATIHDNIILNRNESNISPLMSNLIRYAEHVLVVVQPFVAKFLRKTSHESLNDFVTIYWAVMRSKGQMKGEWKKRTKYAFDGWYDCRYESRFISIDCIKGTFLVDGLTIGFLPKKIISHQLFVRVFGQHVFEVQAAESTNTYITKHGYHDDGRVLYEFYFNDQTKDLIIRERHVRTNEIYELIPHTCFDDELPNTFISNYSHWWNAVTHTVEFRSIYFKDSDFLKNKFYILNRNTGLITMNEIKTKQILINQSAGIFQKLFLQYFIRLDDKPYAYMMGDNLFPQNNLIITIHLSRLRIAFHYNTSTQIITSREYSDMRVDEDQWLGTLTGLTSGLLLSPLSVHNNQSNNYPYRKLIVPFGEVRSTIQNATHQTVTIQRTSLSSDEFFSHYFVFILNDRLCILQSTDSPTGWLYLALLHAMTSHPLYDQYTSMTGMERAFQLLNSAGCSSDQPYDTLSLNILTQIASISPKVDYYPQHMTCMEKIDWNNNGLSTSLQNFGYYLIVKSLIHASQQLNFINSSDVSIEIAKLFKEKSNNEALLKKLYWNYRDSYNPLARLPLEIERDILNTLTAAEYHSILGNTSQTTNYPVIQLVDDLYKKGNVTLKDSSCFHWLPLSQWLNDENRLENIWISLLKLVDDCKNPLTDYRTEGIQRLRRLFGFFHYISNKRNIKPFYIQMLKTALNSPAISFNSIKFPPFIDYQNIEEISFIKKRISISKIPTELARNEILTEIERCWRRNSTYKCPDDVISFIDVTQINLLLRSWRLNSALRTFLQSVQKLIHSVRIEQFQSKVVYNTQKFTRELFLNHYQIKVKSSKKLLNQDLLLKAAQKFHHHHYINHFPTEKNSTSIAKQQRQFPNEIFPFINNEQNPLWKIDNYFRDQLNESWNKFLLNEQSEETYPSEDEIKRLLNSIQDETVTFSIALIQSILAPNELLFNSGVLPRLVPSVLIRVLLERNIHAENSLPFDLTTDQCTLLGGILVNWTLEQQLERALHFLAYNKTEDFKKEISNIPHLNWIPSEHIYWLILELEMNIIIRDIQIKVAHHMMQTNVPTANNIVMQMNMGEGKTSVILPMLAVSLSSINSTLVRIVVLKSLFPTNYQSLRYKLGGLLNRRILPFTCRRDMNLTNEQIQRIHIRFHQALNHCDVILTSPEDLLSFDLLTIDKCRQNIFDTAQSMLTVQQWIKTYARDILDESDEILHVKYQLIYTIGGQKQVDGRTERWKTIQSILELVKKNSADISERFSEETCFKISEQKSAFPQFRLQSDLPYPLLCEKIANDWIDSRNYRQADKQIVLSFLLQSKLSVDPLINKFPFLEIQLFLIIRGLLSSEVLLIALKKRHRVNYGINPNPSFHRLMAVPFRAKDVAADRTEFGHPDVALVLTQLSYYYSGLTDSQLMQCFDHLNERESDPATIYEQWILYEGMGNVPEHIKYWNGVNLEDYHQRTEQIFPTFRYHMLVINYFLNRFVFQREAKQFPYKIVASAWDLSSSVRSKIITGFSGTNDTQLLLPVHIHQHELPELQKTDAIVINNLLQNENQNYQSLPINAISNDILKQICEYKENINVILDVGALFIDKTNRDIAVHWLNLSDKHQIDYAVYFDFDSIVVCDRQYHHQRFETSPASERLDHCVFYLDEIHTRGTDFKFPQGFRAAVTLGNGLTKDRFVQACMRMRQLGHGHSLTFWSSNEVHQQITSLTKQLYSSEQNYVINILRWVYQNTIHSTWEGLHHWAEQSLSFQRKLSASQQMQGAVARQTMPNQVMKEFAEQCLESEIIELQQMYGTSKELYKLDVIYSARCQHSVSFLSSDIHNAVLKRLQEYGGSKTRLSQLLDEEQQRELEQELEEERQSERPSSVTPVEPILHEEIKRLGNVHGDELKLQQLTKVFQPITYAFYNTTLFNNCQLDTWQKNLWVTTEFQRVISSKGDKYDSFLRPPRWIIVYRNKHIIFISPFEANWLIDYLRSSNMTNTTLRLLLPRTKRTQSIFVNIPTLTIPPSITHSNESSPSIYSIPNQWLASLFVFNGTLYFETNDEQRAYCQCLSLCPRPRTKTENKAFEKGWIAIDGFVSNQIHRIRLNLDDTQFTLNPLIFVKQLLENRNNSFIPITSHVGSIIFNSQKLDK